MIGLGLGIQNDDEFNRRARIALTGFDWDAAGLDKQLIPEVLAIAHAGVPPLPRTQQQLFNFVHKYRRRISDKLVTDYAATRAKGAD